MTKQDSELTLCSDNFRPLTNYEVKELKQLLVILDTPCQLQEKSPRPPKSSRTSWASDIVRFTSRRRYSTGSLKIEISPAEGTKRNSPQKVVPRRRTDITPSTSTPAHILALRQQSDVDYDQVLSVRSYETKDEAESECGGEELIRCIAAVVLMHIQASHSTNYFPPDKVINSSGHKYSEFNSGGREKLTLKDVEDVCLQDLYDFLSKVTEHTAMELECLVISLIYLERVMAITDTEFRICVYNWKATLLACVLIASKVWDEYSVTNGAFAGLFGGLTVKRLNTLESTLLGVLDYNVTVTRMEFSQYESQLKAIIAESKVKAMRKSGISIVSRTSSNLSVEDVANFKFTSLIGNRVGGACDEISEHTEHELPSSKTPSRSSTSTVGLSSRWGGGMVGRQLAGMYASVRSLWRNSSCVPAV